MLHAWATEIEKTIFKAEFFGRFRTVVVSVHGERVGAVQELKLINDEFNIASRDVWVFEFGGAFAHFPGRTKNILVTDRFGKRERVLCIRSDDELDKTGKISEINKNQTTVVAAGINPTRNCYGFAKVVF